MQASPRLVLKELRVCPPQGTTRRGARAGLSPFGDASKKRKLDLYTITELKKTMVKVSVILVLVPYFLLMEYWPLI